VKLIPRTNADDTSRGYVFWCPACRELHYYNTDPRESPVWRFDGNMEAPSFSPSLLYVDRRCHLYVSLGRIVYCSDCAHSFAGKTVEMVDLDPGTGRPCMSEEEKAKEPEKPKEPEPKKPKQPKHHTDCGIVGDVGAVGDLGSNAADSEAGNKERAARKEAEKK